MVTIKNHKHRVLHRLKIVRGHLEKIMDMVEKDAYCIDVLHQSLALQKALKSIDIVIMEDHLRTCAVEQIKNGHEEKVMRELSEIYKYK
ncbi:metal-sensing transcriptional repressor [Candidatus Woesebacteria bacterium]|nr:metal-sensing transcriptional repressor [Candidatus Woesebacteria bacterium]